jgi:uncharacterized caspase-like protein
MRAALLILLLCCAPLGASANQRIALVIGNNAYAEQPLFNPVNDAIAVDAALTELGFEVIRATDADLEAMQEALLAFTSRIEEGSTALVFYAGHGVQANGRNYLVPVDARLRSESRLRFEALELGDVLEELEYSPSRLNLVILDACRNNPFLQRVRGGSRGLAAVDAATGTLVAYATAPGSVASDGVGSNGLYTEQLLNVLREPGLQAEAVFKRVRIGVTEASGGEQVPWESSSLTGDFVFNQSAAPSTVVPAAAAADRDALFWESVRDASAAEELRSYLEQFPDGTFAALARTRIAALEADASRAGRCDDLAGAWLERRDDRECASELWFEPSAAGAPNHYDARTTVCPGPGVLGALGAGASTGDAVLDGRTLTGTWQHGPCSGTSTYELDESCTTGTGRIVGTRGLFGTCAGIRLISTLERVDPP